jgi:hypothetical protein
MLPVGIDDRNLEAVHQTDGVYPTLAVVETVIHPLDGRALENPRRVFECNPMQLKIAAVLFSSQLIPHNMYLHNVNM